MLYSIGECVLRIVINYQEIILLCCGGVSVFQNSIIRNKLPEKDFHPTSAGTLYFKKKK